MDTTRIEAALPDPDSKQTGSRWIALAYLSYYLVFVNLPLFVACQFFELRSKGYFAIEYFVLGLLVLFFPRWKPVVAALLFLAICGDILLAACLTFYLYPSSFLSSSDFMSVLPPLRFLAVLGIVLAVAGCAWGSMRIPVARLSLKWRMFLVTILVVLLMIGMAIDVKTYVQKYGQTNPLATVEQKKGKLDAVNARFLGRMYVFRYLAFTMKRTLKEDRRLFSIIHAESANLSPVPSAVTKSGLAATLFSGAPGQQPNLVLILVESWGLAKSSQLRLALTNAYRDPELQRRYRISEGEVEFHGTTIPAEARELCSSAMGFHVLDAPKEEFAHCLPEMFFQNGYRSIAVHGMQGKFFQRNRWYRPIGFQEMYFQSDLKKAGLPECEGAFLGICDGAIADWIGQRLQAKRKQPEFLFWVTLNSHIPVPSTPPVPVAEDCSLAGIDPATPHALCSWYQLVANVHWSVAKLSLSNPDRPTAFLVVGDHLPPFANYSLQEMFSDQVVPWVLLWPNELGDKLPRAPLPAAPAKR